MEDTEDWETYSEGSTIGDADGKIGKDGQQSVLPRLAKGKIVTDFMDGQKQVLVGCSADDVGSSNEFPVKRAGVGKSKGAQDLQRDNGEDEPFGQGFRPTQLGDLGVGLDDGLPT